MKNLYLIYGSNRDLIEEEKNKIIFDSNVDEFNLSVFDMEEVSYKEALSECMNMPFLSEERVVVVRNAYFFGTQKVNKALDNDFSMLQEYLDNYPDYTILIFTLNSDVIDNKKTIVKTMKEKGEIIECKSYTKESIIRYIDDVLKENNLQLKTDARNELMSRLEDDPNNFKNELEKLLIYSSSKKDITKEDVEKIIFKDPSLNAYELLNAIQTKNKKEALNVYYDLIASGKDSLYLLSMISSKFEEILYSKDLLNQGLTNEEFMDALHISKGRAYYMIKQAKEMSYATLRDWLRRCVSLDYQIKSGKITKDAGVELLLLKM